ncbi:MAG: Putrescine transport system permease protein PotH, partial [Pseudomonadota bacterium]
MTIALPQVKQKTHWSEWVGFAGLALVLLLLLAFLAAPLMAILQQAAQDDQGQFVGLKNFFSYIQTPALLHSLWNSVWVSVLVTVIVVP